MNRARQTLCLFAATLGPVYAHAAKPTVTADLGIGSAYVFRGLKQGELTALPSIELGLGDGYAGLYSIVPLNDRDEFLDEHNVYAGFGWALDSRTAMDAGGTFRYRPDGVDAFEAYLGARREYGTVSPSVYIYRDFDAKTWTGELATEVNAPIENLPFTFSAFLGRVAAEHGSDYTYYGIDALYPVELDSGGKLTLGLRYAGSDLGGTVSRNQLYGTAAFTFGF